MSAGQSTLSSGDVAGMIGAIYDCAVDPARWDAVLDDIRRALRCATCVLYVADPVAERQRFQRIVGIEPEWAAKLPLFKADLDHLHSTIPDFYTRPVDEPFVCRNDVPAPVWLESPIYLKWAAPQRLIDFIDIIFMRRRDDRIASCAFGRREEQGEIDDRDVELMRLLAPHLRRAVSIADLIDMKSIVADRLTDTLDALDVAVVLVGADAEIVHANRAAAEMFRACAPVRDNHGRLRTSDPAATDRLHRAIAAATRAEAEIGAAGIGMALPSVEGRRATAHVLPLANGDARAQLEPRAGAAVFISTDTPARNGARLDGVAQAFGLSAAELRVVDRLVKGESIGEAARSLGIAPATAKTHLSRVLAKTGTRRQPDLLTTIHRLTPSVGA